MATYPSDFAKGTRYSWRVVLFTRVVCLMSLFLDSRLACMLLVLNLNRNLGPTLIFDFASDWFGSSFWGSGYSGRRPVCAFIGEICMLNVSQQYALELPSVS